MILFAEFLVESKSKIIQALVQKFGYERVFSKEFDYELNASDFQKIFDTLNVALFAGKLGSIPLHYWTTSQIIKEFKVHSANRKIPTKFYGCFDATYIVCSCDGQDIDTIPGYVPDGTETCKFSNPRIIINRSEVTAHSVFIFVVACICHEMIHYFDAAEGQLLNCMKLRLTTGQVYNSHTTPTFITKMKEANTGKINVQSTLSGLDYRELNFDAYKKLLEQNAKNFKWIYDPTLEKYCLDLSHLSTESNVALIDKTHVQITLFD